jgi:hypothetical protein
VYHLTTTQKLQADNQEQKKKEYLEVQIDELETKSNKKNIRDLCRDINDLKKLPV